MKILLISQTTLRRELGGPKVVIELTEAINELGHTATVVGPEEIKEYLQKNSMPVSIKFARNINLYLQAVGNQYDVIDADANHLYEFKKIDGRTLIVARSVLFIPHLQHIRWPKKDSLKHVMNLYFRKFKYGEELRNTIIDRFYQSMNRADLINVSNHKDVELLLAKGYPENKILHLPYGLSRQKRERLNQVARMNSCRKSIAFVGTFDYRKGCLDLPRLFKKVKEELPDAYFILLGAKGFFTRVEDMYKYFPGDLQASVKIIPAFKESELPDLLQEVRVAVFPSYLEGFPFSVIECMAAGIPVIAYNSPGPSSILKRKYLVAPGDWSGMADKVIHYFTDTTDYERARWEMIEDSAAYQWESIARQTTDVYATFVKNQTAANV